MKISTNEWIEKAEDDWRMAQRAYRARKDPSYDAACFHAQQCVEKYLKARLNEDGIFFRKTHNLQDLLKPILPAEPTWVNLQPALDNLNKYAVIYRYPGFSATKIEAKAAIDDCRKVRRVIRAAFGLPI
jgi:HEPN domain-containing protein